jgi:ProP effector
MRRQELHPRTEIINKKQKNQAKLARHEALSWLAQQFPCVFDNRTQIQPLKLGIMNDILAYTEAAGAAGISKSKLREAVVIFTRRVDYLACLKAREMRVDLQGQAVMPVTEEEANIAAQKLKKRVEKSSKNARKNSAPRSYKGGEDAVNTYYPSYTPALAERQNPSQAARAPSVLVKHKSVRSFDPDAVARLKEKLGLATAKVDVSEEI